MYNTGRGVETGFDSANTSYVDFYSYDSLNVGLDARILCGACMVMVLVVVVLILLP